MTDVIPVVDWIDYRTAEQSHCSTPSIKIVGTIVHFEYFEYFPINAPEGHAMYNDKTPISVAVPGHMTWTSDLS